MADKETIYNEAAPKKHRKQPKRKKHRLRKWLFLIILLAVILFAIFGFQIKSFQITGNERVSDETVQALIQYDQCQNNALLLWLMNRKVDVSSEPLLDGIHIRIKAPQSVIVQVSEEKLAGCVQSGDDYIYVNDTGKIVLKQSELLSDVVLLKDISPDSTEVGTQLIAEDTSMFADFLDITKYLRNEQMTADSLGKAEDNGYYLMIGKVKICLGKDIYMEEKISELNDLLPNLDGLSGTLHLEEYDSTKDSIIFTKDS